MNLSTLSTDLSPDFHKIHVDKLVCKNSKLSKHLELIHNIHWIVDKPVCKSCRI